MIKTTAYNVPQDIIWMEVLIVFLVQSMIVIIVKTRLTAQDAIMVSFLSVKLSQLMSVMNVQFRLIWKVV